METQAIIIYRSSVSKYNINILSNFSNLTLKFVLPHEHIILIKEEARYGSVGLSPGNHNS